MIVTKQWPTHWGFYCYLPIAIGWSVLFYCIKGTRDIEKEEKEEED